MSKDKIYFHSGTIFDGAGIAKVCSIYSFSFTKTSIIGSKDAGSKN